MAMLIARVMAGAMVKTSISDRTAGRPAPVAARFALCLMPTLMSCLGAHAQAPATLDVVFKNPQVTWGRALRGTLEHRVRHEGDVLDLSPWHKDFHVEISYEEASEDDEGQATRRIGLRLYPRGPEVDHIPALTHGRADSSPIAITVRDNAEGIGTPSLPTAPATVYARQAIALTYSIPVAAHDLGLALDDPPHPPGLLFPLEDAATANADGPRHLGWTLVLEQPGDYRLQLPPLRVTRSGFDRYRFYPPPLTVRVAPLPAYIPAGVPVGLPRVSATLIDGDPGSAWRVTVEQAGPTASPHPRIMDQLTALSGASARVLSQESFQHQHMIWTRTIIEAPLPPWSWGWGWGLGWDPGLTVDYFDPEAGHLKQPLIRLPAGWNLPRWAILPIALGLLVALGAGLRFLHRHVQAHRTRKRWMNALRAAGDAHALRRTLLDQTGARTLGDWAAHLDLPGA
ncbi:MAG: hypothetical protein ACPGU7_14315, partial [Gammaproteobacteria bacterium]